MYYSRRDFIDFMGRSGAAVALGSLAFGGCRRQRATRKQTQELPFHPIEPTRIDELTLAEGFDYQIVLEHGRELNRQGAKFGFNNDYIALFDVPGSDSDLLVWVNHESVTPIIAHGKHFNERLTKEEVDLERKEVGGTFARIRFENSKWSLVENDPLNRRIDANTPIPLIAERPIAGSRVAIGTLANCAGGKTPWGTLLTCEENFDDFYGVSGENGRTLTDYPHYWHEYYDHPLEHYGWVVEINPYSGGAKKLISLGRFAHECATVRVTRDGRAVVYSGDDEKFGCLYKFIADRPGTLHSGTLYVANVERGEWISLAYSEQPVLQKRFSDQTDVLIHAPEAAGLVGGSRLDRPEDIEIDPVTGAVLVALTNNSERGNYHGAILRLQEQDNSPGALRFESDEFLVGGDTSGLTCPDNLAFDAQNNLWVTNDVAGKELDKDTYRRFGNNGLFYVPMNGPNAGRPFQVAAAPRAAELTGPAFSPDGRTLFLSVQHPGEDTKNPGQWSSHWPHGGSAKPLSAVVAIRGKALDALTRSVTSI